MPAPNQIIIEIAEELKRNKKKFPSWPDHIVAQAAIVGSKGGDLMRVAIERKYERQENAADQTARLRRDAIQTAALAIRFIENLKTI